MTNTVIYDESTNYTADEWRRIVSEFERVEKLEAALRGLVEAVKAGEAVSGAEALGAAEDALANQK